jgi:hypothetical protein
MVKPPDSRLKGISSHNRVGEIVESLYLFSNTLQVKKYKINTTSTPLQSDCLYSPLLYDLISFYPSN